MGEFEPATIAAVVRSGASSLEPTSETPLLDCQILLGHILNKDRSWLFAHSNETLSREDLDSFKILLDRRTAGEPVSYLTGVKEFWSREFRVSNATLIPRPETETLVELALNRFGDVPLRVADLGTGSGAIAVSLAAERKHWQITGIDVSPDAVAVARQNGQTLMNLSFCVSDWCADLPGNEFDLIVSNPPYIRESDPHLANLLYEPLSALSAGPDGLDCFRELVPASYDCLRPGGALMVEHGWDQQPDVATLFEITGFRDISCDSDLQGTPRTVTGFKP